jgi:hypothetical protein
MEEVRKGLAEVSSQWGPLESGDAVCVEPRIEPVNVGAAAIDGPVAVQAGRWTTDATLFAVMIANSSPVARQTVASSRASAEGGATMWTGRGAIGVY